MFLLTKDLNTKTKKANKMPEEIRIWVRNAEKYFEINKKTFQR